MKVVSHNLEGVFEILPDRFGDDRGFFSETYNSAKFEAAGFAIPFVQDNHSYSAAKGVLRGLHYQLEPYAQDKLVRVVRGSLFDVAVDIRRSSATFGKWTSLVLSRDKWNQFLVPKGYAHGFVTLEDHTEVVYKVSNLYSPQHDRAIRFDDPDIGIVWPEGLGDFQLSDKDRKAGNFADAHYFD
jgi:dTDP-4-dehydrorhamnose 3,5-epimerase